MRFVRNFGYMVRLLRLDIFHQGGPQGVATALTLRASWVRFLDCKGAPKFRVKGAEELFHAGKCSGH